MKPLRFLGSSRRDLQEFPAYARREAGYQLDHVQWGVNPDDWKPMKTIGQGVNEIRIRDKEGAFRLIYIANFADAVYVLHAFQKKPRQHRFTTSGWRRCGSGRWLRSKSDEV